jgi:hypothetical protein
LAFFHSDGSRWKICNQCRWFRTQVVECELGDVCAQGEVKAWEKPTLEAGLDRVNRVTVTGLPSFVATRRYLTLGCSS